MINKVNITIDRNNKKRLCLYQAFFIAMGVFNSCERRTHEQQNDKSTNATAHAKLLGLKEPDNIEFGCIDALPQERDQFVGMSLISLREPTFGVCPHCRKVFTLENMHLFSTHMCTIML